MPENRLSTSLICVLLAGVILCVAAFLRFHAMEERPLHFDEATGARIVGYDLEEKRKFDPKHFHGPLLSTITVPVVRAYGQDNWLSLTITPLRTVTAVAGFLTVAACLFFPARWSLTLPAAALVATSPLLVYYSRMYIHEPLFVFTAVLSLLAVAKFCETRNWIWAVASGISIGLMAATRETVVLALFSWAVSGILTWWQIHRNQPFQARLADALKVMKLLQWKTFTAALCMLSTIYICYSQLGENHAGFIDFFRTFFVYETIPGHEKPLKYYFNLLVIPNTSMGHVWSEAAVLFLAISGYFLAPPGRSQLASRFMLISGLLLLLIFSCISYKTPWLICLAWLHLCIAGGFALAGASRFLPGKSTLLAGILFTGILMWQLTQTYRSSFQWPSDTRNPYAYVPTSGDVIKMTDWLKQVSVQHPKIQERPHVVIGSSYWPLPWYLRELGQTGYYTEASQVPQLSQTPLIFTTQDIPTEAQASHQWLPRGLRHETPLWLGIRNDIWQAYQAHE